MRAALTSAVLTAAVLTAAGQATAAASDGGDARSPIELTVRSRGADAAEGSRTTYAITVRNTSDRGVRNGLVTQQLPRDLRHASSVPRATTAGPQATWRVELPPGSSRELRLTAAPGGPAGGAGTDGKGSGGAARPQTTVCFRTASQERWLTCTSVGDQEHGRSWVSANKVYAVVSAAAALAIGAAGILVLRRRYG